MAAVVKTLLLGGAFCALCGWLMLACKRADAIIADDDRKEICDWLRAPLSFAALAGPARFFLLLYTTVFGRTWISWRFFSQAVVATGLWILLLFSIFIFRMPRPYHFFWYRDGAPELSAYARDWTTVLGNIVFDDKFDYMIPVITFITLVILSVGSSFATLVLCHLLFRGLRETAKSYHTAVAFVFSLVFAAVNGVVWLVAFYYLAFFYVGKISLYSMAEIGELVIKSFAAAVNFPVGLPFQIYAVLVIVAAWWTTCWMALFVVSMLLAKVSTIVLLRRHSLAAFIERSGKPFEYAGWVMIAAAIPLFWLLLTRPGAVVEL